MKFTLFSCLFAILSSSLIILVLHQLRKKFLLSKNAEAIYLLIVYMLCILRLAIPIDFHFTKGIPLSGLFSSISDVILQKTILKVRHHWEHGRAQRPAPTGAQPAPTPPLPDKMYEQTRPLFSGGI